MKKVLTTSEKLSILEMNIYNVIIGHNNISVRDKFESFVKYIGNNVDILMVSKTRIDDTFLE